jgi:phosphate transport system substrate-binding protein
MPRRASVAIFGLMCSSLLSCAPEAGKGTVAVHGAGATFPARIYRKWFADYQAAHPGVKIVYDSLGSGAGINLFSDDKVDFGSSDAAMTDEQIARVKTGGVLMLPVTGGNVVLAYNLPGVGGGLRLSREAYAGIFLGTITSWDDPKIAATNKDLHLPAGKITVVHRAGASGTTFAFTRHLSAVNEAWKAGPGAGLTVEWPGGVMATGTDGVAETIQRTPGAIGYLDFGHAREANLTTAALQNKAGEFVAPSVESGRAALDSVAWPDDFRAFVSDPEGKDSYPIVTFNWLLVHKTYEDPRRAAALKDLCRYVLTDGQKECAPLGYIPLPQAAARRVLEASGGIGP